MADSVTSPWDGPVARALTVLEFLARSSEPMRLSAIANGVGMQKSTIHRILGTLSAMGYVHQVEETGCYRVTLRLWELGTGVIAEHPIKRAAAPFLHRLHLATGETVSLTVLDDGDVLYLDKIISPRPVRFTTRVGSRVPAPLTAGGKAMLAHLPDARAIVRRALTRLRDQRRIALDALMQELAEVRVKGYAESSYSPGIVSFAAPVMARNRGPAAALSVSAPEERLTAKKRADIIEQVRSVCAEIEERVGPL